MDNEQHGFPRPPTRGQSTIGSPTPGSARQLVRQKGLARVSAITLGATAASALGAVAIAVTLHGSTGAASAKSDSAASTTNNTSSDDDSAASGNSDGTGGSGDSGAGAQSQLQPAAPQPQLQPAAPPGNTNNPPSATSGAS